jgi:two-component system nitrogen regulation response regulator GlnG
MSRILIVDDEASICYALRESLADLGHHVEVAASAEEGLRTAGSGPFDALVLDVRLPGRDGLLSMPEFREHIGPAPIIVITAFGNLDTAVKAMEGGAFDYLIKPFDLDQATSVVTRALEKHKASDRLADPEPAVASDSLIGASAPMQELYKSIALVAPTDVPVLITGESGTGKELVARAIHRHSPRKDGPFLPVCLAALSPSLVEAELFGHMRGAFTGAAHDRKGLLELASGGTVLFDEVGDIPPSLQVKLLRAIEHHEVTPVGDARPRATDIRVIAATNGPLAELMAVGQFRTDLFFRLGVFQIHLPPLRDRRDDIPALAEHFLRQSHVPDNVQTRLADEVLGELRSRAWPGNIRELRNTIAHAAIVARGRTIRAEHLPPAPVATAASIAGGEIPSQLAAWARQQAQESPGGLDASTLYDRFLAFVEPPVLRAVLEECRHNRAAAAKLLGIHRATLRQKLRKYDMA